ncbi:putative disease resistance RPP13-like protein 1 isoform X2 [Phragmites australis]|uniref:putative disease resistance RPP13-like protein 1 isoform X2 n=1 Tax=Phragmites australis TaxID=29695 RepID=UPI002D79D719|nr:putative disease resistance RPP13-like protein 1 isoform X2 [Phragmites australis]
MEPEADPVQVPVPDELATRVKKILERFNEITRAWDDLKMDENDAPMLEYDDEMLPLPTNPYADEPNVVGREEDKENVIKLLTAGASPDGCQLSVLPIVGMGGAGKTTLAQLVYNDRRISKYFDIKGWVHVSPDFSVKNLASRILMSFTRRQFEVTEMDDLQDALMEQVQGMKFFLVLDDVWIEDKDLWNALLSPMLSAQLGMILLTTRNESVSRTFQTVSPYHLSLLPFDKSWILFKQLAFGFDVKNIQEVFEETGKKIVEKCGGLPLAIKAIASALRFEPTEETWKEILDSEQWELPRSEDSVLPALRLSFDRMPKSLQRCFIFLTLLPKRYLFLQDNVINLWMSMDVLKQGGRKRLENIGSLYFDDLIQRTMIQRTQSDDGFECFILHDLIHDLLQFVAGEDFLRIDTQYSNGLAQSYRYLSLVASSSDANVMLHSAHIPEGLRIFQIVNATDNSNCYSKLFSFNINVAIADPLWKSFGQLRVLDFSHTGLKTLPDSIGDLKLLRYLSLFKTQITYIPESVCGLLNLKVLDARTYSLVAIPQGIKDLINLRHLLFEQRSPLCMPSGVGQLTKLQSLSRFSIGSGSWHCNIAELHGLVNIREELFITGLRRVSNVDDAQTANLVSKKHLQKLTMEWADGSLPGRCSHHSGNETDLVITPELEEAVFESFRPHRNLKELEVANYGGYRYPSWLGHSSFSQLTKITLHDQRCEFPPPLGQLPQLLELSLQWMRGVQHLGKEFCGQGDTRGFPSLKDLEFENMPTWVEWSGVADGDFPCLHELRIKESIELRYLPQRLSSSLSKLVIKNCDKLHKLPALPNLSSLILKGKLNEELFSDLDLPLLRALKVSLSHNIECILLQNLPSLELLVIRTCRKLQALGGLRNLRSLKLLNIIACPKLHLTCDQPLPQQLERLSILKCPQLEDWLELQNAELYDELQPDHVSDEDREALEVLWDDTDDEVQEEFLDIAEEEDDDGDESDIGPLGFSIDDDDQDN